MAVLIEGLSVVVRKDALDCNFPGGFDRLQSLLPDDVTCSDPELFCMHLRAPEDVDQLISWCEDQGLTFLSNGACIDIAVVDQQNGATAPCDWIDFSHLPIADTSKDALVAVAWLFNGERAVAGIHISNLSMDISTPEGWRYEGSLSEKFIFLPNAKSH